MGIAERDFDVRFITAYQSPFTEAQNGGDDKTA
jgi:hypothetical protein